MRKTGIISTHLPMAIEKSNIHFQVKKPVRSVPVRASGLRGRVIEQEINLFVTHRSGGERW